MTHSDAADQFAATADLSRLRDSVVAITRFDERRRVVTTADGRHVLVNSSLGWLIEELRNGSDSEGLRRKFNARFGTRKTESEFRAFVGRVLTQNNLLDPPARRGRTYLTWQFEVINARLAGALATPLQLLFYRGVFPVVFGSTLVFSFAMLLVMRLEVHAGPRVVFSTFALVCVSMLLHELGHIAACRATAVRHGGIGIGFYYLFPVVYADLTGMWQCSRRERLMANSGGICMEIVFCAILFGAGSVAALPAFTVAASVIFFKTLSELNPFLRFDGYWILSDLTNEPNLQQKANAAARRLWRHMQGKGIEGNGVRRSRRREAMLALYGVLNLLFLFFYSGAVLMHYGEEILLYPFRIVAIAGSIFGDDASSVQLDPALFWITGLYVMVGHLLWRFFTTRLRGPRKRSD